jgi:hypothetical protein
MNCLIEISHGLMARSFALLDRYTCSMPWDVLYFNSIVSDLARYGSDHLPISIAN